MPDPTTRARRTERFDLRALYETSRLLSASLDLDFVLNNLLLTAMSKLLVMRGLVLLYEPLEDDYRVAQAKGLTGLAVGDQLRLGDVPADRLLRGDEVPPALASHRIGLVLPIAFGHRQIGLIALGQKATGAPYEDLELEFTRSLVNMSSSAVHNSLMVEELKQANRDLDAKVQEMNTLFDLSQEFNATVDRDRLVKLLSFALMGQMLVGKHLFLMRRVGAGAQDDGAAPDFRIVTARGIGDTRLEPMLIEKLCKQKDLVLLQGEEAEAEAWTGLRRRGLVLAMPIRHQGETCGMLCLGPKMTGQPYQPGDLEFLYALGNLAFVSLQNSYLVEEQIEKERLEEEMRLARTIQEGLLPSEIPTLPGIDIAALALPSRHVGGDYFDVDKRDAHRLLLAIADVTGKGVPAALLMANLQASIRTMMPMELTIETATAHTNRVICENTGFDKFITFFHGIYDDRTHAFDYVNAGHNPPMLLRADGELELLEKGGLLLGVMRDIPYERGTTTLAPGDVLVLFTDGVTEAMGPGDEEYGEDRLEMTIRGHRHASAQAILDAIRASIRDFTGSSTSLSDDLTLIVFKVEA
jgi:sigma-B regulation protein RsbU (phosphoserine phosphatase)